MAGPFRTFLLLFITRFCFVNCQDCGATWMFEKAADIVEDDLRIEIMVGQVYNITCSAVCGTHFWEINNARLSSSSSYVDNFDTVDQMCNEDYGDCEQSTSLLPCENAIEGERLFSRLSIRFKTPGTYIVQCRSRIVFASSGCDTVYTFYSRHRHLSVQAQNMEVLSSRIVPTTSISRSVSISDIPMVSVSQSNPHIMRTFTEMPTPAEMIMAPSASLATSCQPSLDANKLMFTSPEVLLGLILLGVALLSAFTAVMVFLTVCWYKRQRNSLKDEVPMTTTKAKENEYVGLSIPPSSQQNSLK